MEKVLIGERFTYWYTIKFGEQHKVVQFCDEHGDIAEKYLNFYESVKIRGILYHR